MGLTVLQHPSRKGSPPRVRFKLEGQTICDLEVLDEKCYSAEGLCDVSGACCVEERGALFADIGAAIGKHMAATQGQSARSLVFSFEPLSVVARRRKTVMLDALLEACAVVVVDAGWMLAPAAFTAAVTAAACRTGAGTPMLTAARAQAASCTPCPWRPSGASAGG